MQDKAKAIENIINKFVKDLKNIDSKVNFNINLVAGIHFFMQSSGNKGTNLVISLVHAAYNAPKNEKKETLSLLSKLIDADDEEIAQLLPIMIESIEKANHFKKMMEGVTIL